LQGFVSGGKDGVVRLWDESFGSCLKTYQLHSSAIEEGRGRLFADLPPIRALSLGQGKILVGTKHSEVSNFVPPKHSLELRLTLYVFSCSMIDYGD
jgi:WD40 repeat protein